jgi:hypothetical protein
LFYFLTERRLVLFESVEIACYPILIFATFLVVFDYFINMSFKVSVKRGSIYVGFALAVFLILGVFFELLTDLGLEVFIV